MESRQAWTGTAKRDARPTRGRVYRITILTHARPPAILGVAPVRASSRAVAIARKGISMTTFDRRVLVLAGACSCLGGAGGLLLAGCGEPGPAAADPGGAEPPTAAPGVGHVSANGFVHDGLGFGFGFGPEWTVRNAELEARGVELGQFPLTMTREVDDRVLPFKVSIRVPEPGWRGPRAGLQAWADDMTPAFSRAGVETIDIAGHTACRIDWCNGTPARVEDAQRWICFDRDGYRVDVKWDGIDERDLAAGQAVVDTWTWYD